MTHKAGTEINLLNRNYFNPLKQKVHLDTNI